MQCKNWLLMEILKILKIPQWTHTIEVSMLPVELNGQVPISKSVCFMCLTKGALTLGSLRLGKLVLLWDPTGLKPCSGSVWFAMNDSNTCWKCLHCFLSLSNTLHAWKHCQFKQTDSCQCHYRTGLQWLVSNKEDCVCERVCVYSNVYLWVTYRVCESPNNWNNVVPTGTVPHQGWGHGI